MASDNGPAGCRGGRGARHRALADGVVRLGNGRQLQDSRLLSDREVGQMHDDPVGTFQRVMMGLGLVHDDLAEPLHAGGQLARWEKAERPVDGDVLFEGEFCAWRNTNYDVSPPFGSKAAGSGCGK